jgi:hypothetical protein
VRRILAFALVGGLALTACSSGSDSKSASLDAQRASARATTTSTTAAFAAATTHPPGSLRNLEGARADVHDTECVQHDDAWKATGKVTNPTGGPVRYRVYVSFLHGDVTVGVAEANTGSVAPKASEDWTTSVKLGTDGLRCILRVERADA